MSTGVRPSNHSVRLNADQREVAASIAAAKGISQAEAEQEYARQLLRFQQLKSAGQYPER